MSKRSAHHRPRRLAPNVGTTPVGYFLLREMSFRAGLQRRLRVDHRPRHSASPADSATSQPHADDDNATATAPCPPAKSPRSTPLGQARPRGPARRSFSTVLEHARNHCLGFDEACLAPRAGSGLGLIARVDTHLGIAAVRAGEGTESSGRARAVLYRAPVAPLARRAAHPVMPESAASIWRSSGRRRLTKM